MVLIIIMFLIWSCKVEKEPANIYIELYNNFEEDLYIYLSIWNVSIENSPELIDDFNLSKNLVVNKIISSNTKIGFNNQFPHPINTTITLTQKEPVFLEFNKSDSIILNLKVKEHIENYPLYIQLISFSKKDIKAIDIEYLLFHKKKLNIDLMETMKPFEENEMLESIDNFGYFDSINIVPIELMLTKNKVIKLSDKVQTKRIK